MAETIKRQKANRKTMRSHLAKVAADKFAAISSRIIEDEYSGMEFIYIRITAEELRKQNQNALEKLYEIPEAFPKLDVVEDGEWHFVSEINRVGCRSGIGWYRALYLREASE